MRLIPSALIAVGAVAGISGAAAAYQAATSDEPVVTRTVSNSPDPTPSTVVNLLPCEDGSELRDDVCVRIEDQVVTPTPTSPNAPGAGPTSSPTSGVDDDDDEFEDSFEDGDDDGRHGDDDGPDHDADDDHGDDLDDDSDDSDDDSEDSDDSEDDDDSSDD